MLIDAFGVVPRVRSESDHRSFGPVTKLLCSLRRLLTELRPNPCTARLASTSKISAEEKVLILAEWTRWSTILRARLKENALSFRFDHICYSRYVPKY